MKNNKTIGIRLDEYSRKALEHFCSTNNITITETFRKFIKIIEILPAISNCETWDMLIALEKFNGQTKSEMIRKMLDIYVKQLFDKIPKEKLEEKK